MTRRIATSPPRPMPAPSRRQRRPKPKLTAVQRAWIPRRRAKQYYYTHNPHSFKSWLRFALYLNLAALATILLLPIALLACITLIGLPVGLLLLGAPIGRLMIRRGLHKVYWENREMALTTYDDEGNEMQVPWNG